MLVKTFGSAVYGVEAISITIEVNSMTTGTFFALVGLPDNAVKESLQRVESTKVITKEDTVVKKGSVRRQMFHAIGNWGLFL